MTYEEIYSQFYTKEIDPTFFEKYTKDEAYELMKSWLHSIVAIPYIRKCFNTITLDDETMELTFELVNPVNEDSDNYFIKDVFAQGLKICWMEQQVDTVINLSVAVGGKEEKTILNNYKTNISRLEQLKVLLRKKIRDYGYCNNDYIGEK